MAQLVGDAVSIASVSEWKLTSRARRLRPSQQGFRTISVSLWSGFFTHRRRAGRLVVTPDNPLFFEDVGTEDASDGGG